VKFWVLARDLDGEGKNWGLDVDEDNEGENKVNNRLKP